MLWEYNWKEQWRIYGDNFNRQIYDYFILPWVQLIDKCKENFICHIHFVTSLKCVSVFLCCFLDYSLFKKLFPLEWWLREQANFKRAVASPHLEYIHSWRKKYGCWHVMFIENCMYLDLMWVFCIKGTQELQWNNRGEKIGFWKSQS